MERSYSWICFLISPSSERYQKQNQVYRTRPLFFYLIKKRKKERNSTKQCTHAIEAHPPQVSPSKFPPNGDGTHGGKENGKKWRAQRGEKNSNSLCFTGEGRGKRKTVRDAEGRKNRVNTESSDPIPSWTGLARGVRKGEWEREGGGRNWKRGKAPLLRRWRGIAIFRTLVG